MGASNTTQTVRNEVDPWMRAREDTLYNQANAYSQWALSNQNNAASPQNIPGVAGMNPMMRSAQEYLWNAFAGGQGSGLQQAQQAANTAGGIAQNAGTPWVQPLMLGGGYGGGNMSVPNAPPSSQNWGSPFQFGGFTQQPYGGGHIPQSSAGTWTSSGFAPTAEAEAKAEEQRKQEFKDNVTRRQQQMPMLMADGPATAGAAPTGPPPLPPQGNTPQEFAAYQDALWERVWAAQDAAGVPREVRNPGQIMAPSDPNWTADNFSLDPFRAANPASNRDPNAPWGPGDALDPSTLSYGGGKNPADPWGFGLPRPPGAGGPSLPGPGIPGNPWDPSKPPGTPPPPIGPPPIGGGAQSGPFAPAWGPGIQNGVAGIANYRDPYESQVVDSALSDIDRSRQLAQGQNASYATQAGAFGGDRHAILEAETNRSYGDQAARTAAQLRSQGFDRAASLAQQDATRQLQGGIADQSANLTANLANQNAFFQGRNQQLQGAGLLSSFGGDVFNRTLGTGQVLSGVGGAQQAQSQAELDDYIARMYESRDYPMQLMGNLQGMLSGFPVGMNQTMMQPRNRGAGFAGGAMTGAGIGASLGLPAGGIGAVPAAFLGAGLGGLLGLL